MPQDQELAALAQERVTLESRVGELQTRVEDLTRDQRKADADVEQVKSRRTRDQQRLDTGAVTNPKDLEHLQSELVSLERRISELEDTELEVMEELETAQAELDQQTARLGELAARMETLASERDAGIADIDAELATIGADRGTVIGDLPADLLALYDRIREQKGGVGAALLRGRRCEGCSLEVNPAELSAIAKAASDEVVRCEECGRILVRTGESGI
jgi:hypothetical protein